MAPDKVSQKSGDLLKFESNLIAKGHSGGGLFNNSLALVGMIKADHPPDGVAVRIEKILDNLRQWGYPVNLTFRRRINILSSTDEEAFLMSEKQKYGDAWMTDSSTWNYYLSHFSGNRRSARKQFLEALQLESLKDFEGAKQKYKSAINLDPKFVFAHNNLGILFKNDSESAKKHYKRAIEIDPNFAAPYINLGVLYSNQNDKKKARRNYERAIEIDPNLVEAYLNLGLLYNIKFKDYKAAKRYYEKAIEIKPDYVNAHLNLGILYSEKFKDNTAAEHHFEQAIKGSNQQSSAAWINMGIFYHYNLHDYQQAKRCYTEAMRYSKPGTSDYDKAKNNMEKLPKD